MTQIPPPPVRTDGSNAFARRSMAERVPGILDDTIERNPDYPQRIRDALRDLSEQIAGDEPLRPIRPPAPDLDLWRRRFAPHEGDTWLDADWFFAETLAYRLVLEACDYWTTRRDPFAPFKQEELSSDALWATLEAALDAADAAGSRDEKLGGLLTAALWGNRMDRSVARSREQGTAASDEHLLANDLPGATRHLLAGEPGEVHVIMDNAGTEQVLDFALTDALLDTEAVRSVVLHVKMQPVLVSDAIGADVEKALQAMEQRSDEVAALAHRLREYAGCGRLGIVPDFFWSTDGSLRELPPRLYDAMQGARLVISKGDANYRRITNDALWPPDAAFTDAAQGLPVPLLALRTLKSDTLVGVGGEQRARLDEEHSDWRTSGTYGVAQFAE